MSGTSTGNGHRRTFPRRHTVRMADGEAGVTPGAETNAAEARTGIDVDSLRADLERSILSVLPDSSALVAKSDVRRSHSLQRALNAAQQLAYLRPRAPDLLRDFASGSEIDPSRVDPLLTVVSAETRDADLFRLATLLWSVPVSRGYGRRIRFLVRDRQNGKVIGLFALGDPVFNLRDRDRFVGWNADDRRERLADVMDAFVVGAIPPYAQLLGGKLVFSLIGSREVGEAFESRYAKTIGIISGKERSPRLVLVTVTSALGRSSLYNRLRLTDPDRPGRLLVDLRPVGWTTGYGHFQVDDLLFRRVRAYLESLGHPYANGHRFGSGPNWRMRVLRVALEELGLDGGLLKHGIRRQVFAMPLAENWREYLAGREPVPVLERPPMAAIAGAALSRWVIPRAERHPAYRDFDVRQLEEELLGRSESPFGIEP